MESIIEFAVNQNLWRWAILSATNLEAIKWICKKIIQKHYLRICADSEMKMQEQYIHEAVYRPDFFFYSVFEILVSGSFVLIVIYIYCLFTNVWNQIGMLSNFAMLALIMISVKAINAIDKYWLDKMFYSPDNYNKSPLRIIGSITILLWLMAFAIVYNTTKYSNLIGMLTCLVAGRFLYFDSTMESVKQEIKTMVQSWRSAVVAMIILMVNSGLGVYFEIISKNNAIVDVIIGQILCFIVFHFIQDIIADIPVF